MLFNYGRSTLSTPEFVGVDGAQGSREGCPATILPNRDHDVLDSYENQELYSWFLGHERGAK